MAASIIPKNLYRKMSRAIRKGTLSGLNTEANNNKVRWQNLLRSNFKTLPPNLTKEQSVIIGEEFLQLRSSTFNHIDLLNKYWIGTHIPQRDRMERDANRVGLRLPKTFEEKE